MLVLLLAMTPVAAIADPIKLAGIDLTMTVKQQEEALTKLGFICNDPNKFGCNREDKLIIPSDKTIVFTCENFNACDHSIQELAQAIVDNGVISGLSYDPKVYSSGGSSKLVERFCGRGTDGDILCVIADKLGSKILLKVTIERGSLGSGGISIN